MSIDDQTESIAVQGEPTAPPTRTAQRNSSIDAFRALICLQIVWAHCYKATLFPVLDQGFGSETSWYFENIRFGYSSFFVIAGYFLALNFRAGEQGQFSVPTFFFRRMLRLAVPYWCAILLFLGTRLLTNSLSGRQEAMPTAREFASLMFFSFDFYEAPLVSGPHWSMAPLFQFYALWGVAFCLIRFLLERLKTPNLHEATIKAIIPLTVLLMFASLWFLISQGADGNWKLPFVSVYFCLGCLAYWRTAGYPTLIPLLVGVACLEWGGLMVNKSQQMVSSGITTLLLLWLTRYPSTPDWRIFRVLVQISVWSYSIYLTHLYLGLRIINIPNSFGWTVTAPQALLIVLIAFLVAIPMGALFYQLVEKPLAVTSRKIKYRA